MRSVRVTPEADRVFLVGQTRKGKTTISRFIIEGLQPVRVIAFDVKDELDLGVPKLRTPLELAQGMNSPIVHYVPSGFYRDELEEVCQIVWVTPGPYVWWITEASAITNASYCPAGLRLACTQGAAQRKLVISETQRVAESNPVLRAGADHVFMTVPAPIELDLKTLAGVVRREHTVLKQELDQLHAEHGPYSHLWYVLEDDELRACAPLPLGRSRPHSPPHTAEEEPLPGADGRQAATQPDEDAPESPTPAPTPEH